MRPAGSRDLLLAALVTYCERDTLALVRLVAFFEGQGTSTAIHACDEVGAPSR